MSYLNNLLDYASLVAEGRLAGRYYISKYGRNVDVDAAEDIWQGGGDYTGFPTTAAEQFQVLSSSAADTAAGTGARTVRIYYLDSTYVGFDGGGVNLFVDVTLNGVTPVNTGITGMRVWRLEVLTAGSGGANAGTLTVRWVTTPAVVFISTPAGTSQSQSSAYTVPAGHTLYVKRYAATMFDTTTNSGGMCLKTKSFAGVTASSYDFAIDTGAPFVKEIEFGLKFLEKTDIVFRCTQVLNANADISVSWDSVLVKN